MLQVVEVDTGLVLCKGSKECCYAYLRRHRRNLRMGRIDLRYENGRAASYVL